MLRPLPLSRQHLEQMEPCCGSTSHLPPCRCRVREQQDVLRPYCSLNYAWDEPAQPHRLVLELPGSRALGTFNLDQASMQLLSYLATCFEPVDMPGSRPPSNWTRQAHVGSQD